MDEKDNRISKYNEATLQLQRLHNHWVAIENALKHGNCDLKYWKFKLESVWRELVADVDNQKNSIIIMQKNKLLKEAIAKAEEPEKLYDVLNLRHEFLKVLQDKVGKGGAYLDDSTEDME